MFRTRSRLVPVAAALAFASLGLTSCSGSPENTSAEPTELRMLVNVTPVLTLEFWDELVAPWEEANPNVDVVIEAPATNVGETLQQQLAAGTEPDIVDGAPIAMAEVLAELPDEDWVDDTPLVEENAVDGVKKIVGTGLQMQSLVFYNKDAFEAAGIDEAPTTVEEFTEALTALKGAGYVPLSTAGEWVTGSQFLGLAGPTVMRDEPEWIADRNAGDVSFAESNYNDYLQVYADWVAQGLVPADANALTYDDATAAFTSGKAATYTMGSWIVPTIDDAATDFEVGVFRAPTFDGKPGPLTGNPAVTYGVLDTSDKKDLAFDLVEYLTSDETAVTTALSVEGNYREGYPYEASELTNAIFALADESTGFITPGTGLGSNIAPLGYGDQVKVVVQGLYVGDSVEGGITLLDDWWTANAQ
jgi:ABC-type glycerol-3-phosphate transport system substrate-binding protein